MYFLILQLYLVNSRLSIFVRTVVIDHSFQWEFDIKAIRLTPQCKKTIINLCLVQRTH